MFESAIGEMDQTHNINDCVDAMLALFAADGDRPIEDMLCARLAAVLGDANIALVRGRHGFAHTAAHPIATYPVGASLPRLGIDHVLSNVIRGSGSPDVSLVAWRWPADRMFTSFERQALATISQALEPVASCLSTESTIGPSTRIDPETGFLCCQGFLDTIDDRIGRDVPAGALLLVGWIARDADAGLDAPVGLIRRSAEQLRCVSTFHDLCGRIAATRLAIWTDHIDAAASQMHANRTIEALDGLAVAAARRVAVGLAAFPADGPSASGLLHAATAALERARLQSAVRGSSVAQRARRRR